MAHILRRGARGGPASVGEAVARDLEGGLTALSSIAPTSYVSGGAAKRNTPLTQTPYYKALVKGEKLKPRPGRADDFSWPNKAGRPAG